MFVAKRLSGMRGSMRLSCNTRRLGSGKADAAPASLADCGLGGRILGEPENLAMRAGPVETWANGGGKDVDSGWQRDQVYHSLEEESSEMEESSD